MTFRRIIMPLFGRKKDPQYEEAARLLADGYLEEAIVNLRSILQENPEHENAIISLAIALTQVQEPLKKDDPLTMEALELFDEAAMLNPNNAVPLFNKAVTLRKLGKKQEAFECFDKVLTIEKRNPLAILHKAEIQYELGNYEEAVILARLALTRDPGLESAMGWVRDAMRKAGMLPDEGNPLDK